MTWKPFRRTTPAPDSQETPMPDSPPTPTDLDYSPPQPRGDNTTTAEQPAVADDPETKIIRRRCDTCGQTMPTINEVLRATIDLIPDGGALVLTFYTDLLDAAPTLAGIFPPDLIDAVATGEGRGAHQREVFLEALLATSKLFDPGNAESMERLNAALKIMAGQHTAFQNRITGETFIPGPEHYKLAGDTLLAGLRRALGQSWTVLHEHSWWEAYKHVWRVMWFWQGEQQHEYQFPRFVRDSH
jgi:hemoglobin-like flavoprotein